MEACRCAALALVGALVLSACTPGILTREDRAKVCRVAVVEEPGAFVFRPNPYFDPVGGPVRGAGTGALIGAAALFMPLYAPAAVVAVGMGIECGAASSEHPNAERDFRQIFETADKAALKDALAAELRVRLAACRTRGEDVSGADTYDTVVHIDRVEYAMQCSRERETYSIAVKWRATTAAGGRVLRAGTTNDLQRSPRDVDAWAADAAAARAEVERALADTGRRIAAGFLDADRCWNLAATGLAVVETREDPPPAGAGETFESVVWRGRIQSFPGPTQPSALPAGTLVLADRLAVFVPSGSGAGVRIPYELVENVDPGGSAAGASRSIVIRSCYGRSDEFTFVAPDMAAKAAAVLEVRAAAAR